MKIVLRRVVILKSIVMIAITVVASTAALADTFDWRNVGSLGLDYMTPVQDQGAASTCWAFAAVGALEAKFDIYNSNPNLNLNLSEQHLVCDGSMGGIDGGWEYMALNYFRTNNIVNEATLPYTDMDTSPLWPLTTPYDLYGITANQNWLDCTTNNLKNNLITNGPLVTFIDADVDFYSPSGIVMDNSMPDYYEAGLKAGLEAWHAVVIAGFVDDTLMPSGGYWIVKNSWGASWNGDGYGYITYGVTEARDRTHALTGDPFIVTVPVPGAVLLGILGLGAVGIKLRRYA